MILLLLKLLLNGLVYHEKKLVIEKDNEASFVANTLNSLYKNNDAKLNTEIERNGLINNKAEQLVAAEPELVPEFSTIWPVINGIRDTVMARLDEVTLAYDNKLRSMEAEVNRVRSDHENKLEILNTKYNDLSFELEFKKTLEAKVSKFEVVVNNLKTDMQKLRYENNLLKSKLLSFDGSMYKVILKALRTMTLSLLEQLDR